MSFDYDKIQSKDDGANWSSYSDLFMMLSLVFILLYVVANLRSGTFSVQKNAEYQSLTKQVEDLKQQLEVYNTLKQDYLNRGATQQEKELYSELMGKLDLLKEEAKDEKDALRKQAEENEKKENALNKYQQMIRNLINSNMIAQNRIKRREEIIQKKEDIITQKYKEVENLERVVAEKKREVTKGEKEIARVTEKLDEKINQLNNAFKQQKISKKKLEEKIQAIKFQSQEEIDRLKESNTQITTELSSANQQLVRSKSELNEVNTKLSEKEEKLGELVAKLEGSAQAHREALEKEKARFRAQADQERKAFDEALNKERLSGAQRAQREAEFQAQAKERSKALEGKIADLENQVRTSDGELAKARSQMNARKEIAKRIGRNFKAAGIDAEVDPNTGEVTLSFGQYYFDTDRHDLKPEMKEKINQLVPIYARSLFEDKKVEKLISSIEIIGFASPTYQGKIVDPQSLESTDRSAVNYNLDLSYRRGKAVFNHIFDPSVLKFRYQKELWPLVKVTGRSFLAEAKKERTVSSSMTQREFCQKYDCYKAQKVLIKFNLKD